MIEITNKRDSPHRHSMKPCRSVLLLNWRCKWNKPPSRGRQPTMQDKLLEDPTMKSKIQIVKASGEKAWFSAIKLRKSLQRSGASEAIIEAVIKEVQDHLQEGMTTKKIYQLAFNFLKKKQQPAASKYKLKKAIMELGPSGYPFEKYVSEILKYQGHKIKLNQNLTGRCVNHEIDILAERDGVQKVFECKYHNLQGTICDVKIPLYVHSRFNDLNANPENKTSEGWIATNTRFSTDAIAYALCAKLNLLGWDYPEGNGIREMIDQAGLYPITCLQSLSQKERVPIMEAGLVLCRDVPFNKKLLKEVGFSTERVEQIIAEAALLSQRIVLE